jgi:hypothetical protein
MFGVDPANLPAMLDNEGASHATKADDTMCAMCRCKESQLAVLFTSMGLFGALQASESKSL